MLDFALRQVIGPLRRVTIVLATSGVGRQTAKTCLSSRLNYTCITYNRVTKAVVETPTFEKNASKEWSIDERLEFITWIAANSDAGDVIPGADGVRKVRWSATGTGKRGDVRVIYYNMDRDLLLLIDIYKKNKKSNVTLSEIERAK